MSIAVVVALAACYCPCGTMGLEADRQEAYASAEWVVKGRVIAAEITQWVESSIQPGVAPQQPGTVRYRLEVQRAWKGKYSAELLIYAERQNTTCGATLDLGESYILYLDRRNGRIDIDTCSRRLPFAGSFSERTWLDSQN